MPVEPVPLSVVMPVFNEEEAIVLAVGDVQRDVLDRVPGAELVVIDDGSRDQTGALLDKIGSSDPRVRVIHQDNSGHGGALMTGLEAARGDIVLLVDSDRQIPLTDFPKAWVQMDDGRDGVFGVRRNRQDPQLRLFLSRFIQAAVMALFAVRLRDANVPYKLIRRAIWVDARPCIPHGTLAPSLLLAIFARKRGYDIVELDVAHKERDTGRVSIRRFKLLKFCARGLAQMLTFRRCLSRVG